jgi:hypothetical protein
VRLLQPLENAGAISINSGLLELAAASNNLLPGSSIVIGNGGRLILQAGATRNSGSITGTQLDIFSELKTMGTSYVLLPLLCFFFASVCCSLTFDCIHVLLVVDVENLEFTSGVLEGSPSSHNVIRRSLAWKGGLLSGVSTFRINGTLTIANPATTKLISAASLGSLILMFFVDLCFARAELC